MKIKFLKLKNYRNCTDLKLDLDGEKVIIIGKNAQGKTNILESIFFLSTLKSQRTSNNVELIKFEEEKCEINAITEKSDTEIELKFSYTKEKKRELLANGLKTKPRDFKNSIKTVLFSTQDLLLLRGTPSDRRNWLDTAISQIYPAYEERLSKYNKIRIQKNNFLKEYKQNDTLFEVYNDQLAVLGSNIIFLRLKFLKEIEKIASEKHSVISGKEKLLIKYDCHFLPEEKENLTVENILEFFRKKLDERKELEIIRGHCMVGPQRHDLVFFINNAEATKFASQGQQRTVVLSLKLAELEIISEKFGESPVLLLDDVLAELDDLRQNFLLQTIKNSTQTIITSVDTLLFDKKFLENVKIYKISDGKISE